MEGCHEAAGGNGDDGEEEAGVDGYGAKAEAAARGDGTKDGRVPADDVRRSTGSCSR